MLFLLDRGCSEISAAITVAKLGPKQKKMLGFSIHKICVLQNSSVSLEDSLRFGADLLPRNSGQDLVHVYAVFVLYSYIED